IYVSASFIEKTGEAVLKIVNSTDKEKEACIDLGAVVSGFEGKTLTGDHRDAHNSIDKPDRVVLNEIKGSSDTVNLSPYSFTVIRIK
nr:hypothetical protein [Lachnospiraceae bacterium]